MLLYIEETPTYTNFCGRSLHQESIVFSGWYCMVFIFRMIATDGRSQTTAKCAVYLWSLRIINFGQRKSSKVRSVDNVCVQLIETVTFSMNRISFRSYWQHFRLDFLKDQIWALFLGAIYTRWDLSLYSLFIMKFQGLILDKSQLTACIRFSARGFGCLWKISTWKLKCDFKNFLLKKLMECPVAALIESRLKSRRRFSQRACR